MLDLSLFFFFFKQKTAYEMRISDWSSDVCSSDLSINESFFQGHFPRQPVMPGVLIIESMAQTAAVLVVSTLGPEAEGKLVYRSEERRVGKECVSTCRSRWSPYH